MALTYAIAIVLPVVGTFFVLFGVLEDSGYLPRLAVMVNRIFRGMGLNGKAVLPMILGLGCDTMATLTTRILPTRKERVASHAAARARCSVLGATRGHPRDARLDGTGRDVDLGRRGGGDAVRRRLGGGAADPGAGLGLSPRGPADARPVPRRTFWSRPWRAPSGTSRRRYRCSCSGRCCCSSSTVSAVLPRLRGALAPAGGGPARPPGAGDGRVPRRVSAARLRGGGVLRATSRRRVGRGAGGRRPLRSSPCSCRASPTSS